jgi:hypothetical protein
MRPIEAMRASAERGLDVRYNERCGKAFTGRIEWFERFFQILRNGTLTESIAYLAGRSVGVTFQIAAGLIVMRERLGQKQKRPATAVSAGQERGGDRCAVVSAAVSCCLAELCKANWEIERIAMLMRSLIAAASN